jgi:hypothetical protein
LELGPFFFDKAFSAGFIHQRTLLQHLLKDEKYKKSSFIGAGSWFWSDVPTMIALIE